MRGIKRKLPSLATKPVFGLFFLLVPVFAADYTTYIADHHQYNVAAMATDSAGNTYLTGSRILSFSPYKPEPLSDVFVSKLDPTGKIVLTVTFGGTGSDQPTAIAVDPSGNVYVGGNTTSFDFPLIHPLNPSPFGAFVVKLGPNGSILYSTYFSPLGSYTRVSSLATDTKGNLYLTGSAWGGDLGGAYLAEVSAAGDKIAYSRVFAGSQIPFNPLSTCIPFVEGLTTGVGVVVDADGNAYIAGNTCTTDLPTTPGALATQGIGAFVAKVNAGGAGLAYLTYIGSTDYFAGPAASPANRLQAIAVDSVGNVYLAGATNDPKFPATQGAYQTTYSSSTAVDVLGLPLTDAFLAKLSADGSKMLWATYLGGTGTDSAGSIAVDSKGNVWAVGTTTSSSFPNPNGWSQGGDFLVELSSSGSELAYAARYPDHTASQSVALDSATGLVHVAGSTGIVSGVAPGHAPTMRVFGITNAAGGLVSGRVSPAEVISIYGPHIGPPTPVWATADSSGTIPTSLAGVEVMIGGFKVPLLYVSDSQINAAVPVAGNPASVRISNAGTTTPAFPAVVLDALPQVFRSPDGSAAAVNEDGSLNSEKNPAKFGTVVTVWATGAGLESLAVREFQIASEAAYTCYSCRMNTYPGFNQGLPEQAPVVYAGAAPGMVGGIMQINFRPPYSSPTMFTLTAGDSGQTSDPFLVYVQ